MTPLSAWPALATDSPTPSQLHYDRAVWGKAHAMASDYRWLAQSPTFDYRTNAVPAELALGSEDRPLESALWRVVDGVGYAAACYPSRATDAAGRSGFLEKQILQWRLQDAPSALGALFLIPRVVALPPHPWWAEREDPRWEEDGFALPLDPGDAPPIEVAAERLEEAQDRALAALEGELDEHHLVEVYAGLLAGGRGLVLAQRDTPLPAAALAALLLPLPRADADRLALATYLPSRQVSDAALARWDLAVLPSGMKAPAAPSPTAAQRRQAERMVRALSDRDPSRLAPSRPQARAAPVVADTAAVQVAMWGPSAAGKTALLAQIYLQTRSGGGWRITSTEQVQAFIEQMREVLRADNAFPPATTLGHAEQIAYRFHHRHDGRQALLMVEDRAGRESEDLDEKGRERLRAADGLFLLFDASRSVEKLEAEFWQTFERIHTGGPEPDPRPIAVCLSKADLMIDTLADLERARSDPHDFVVDHAPSELLAALERYCENYCLFPVSSAGVFLHYGVIEPVVFYDEWLAPRIRRDGRGLNLMEPFDWLFNEITAREGPP